MPRRARSWYFSPASDRNLVPLFSLVRKERAWTLLPAVCFSCVIGHLLGFFDHLIVAIVIVIAES